MSDDVLDALGLECGPAEHDIALADGVTVTVRTPTSLDTTRATRAIAEVLQPARGLAAAVKRYGLPAEEWGAAADPDLWEGIGAYLHAVELAAIIGLKVERVEAEGDARRVWSVAPSAEVFAWLLRQKGNLAAFMKATDQAGSELIRPKKPPAP